MPQIIYEVPETYETITRPVVYNVIDQLELITMIARDVRVLFPGGVEVGHQIGSAVEKTRADGSTPPQNTFLSQGQLSVRVEENFVEDRVLSTAVTQRQNNPIFYDPALGVDIRPVYSFNELTLNFVFRTPNLTLARRFRDDLKMRRSQGRVENLHELNYSYGIPLPFFPILGEIYTLREAVAGYDQTFPQWFDENVTDKQTVVTNMAGNQPNVVIREPQIGVMGWFDHLVTVDEPQRGAGAGTGAYEVSFTYKIQYDHAIACVMRFPIIVHNQIVPESFRGNGHIYQLNQRMRSPAWTRFLFDQFTPLYPSDVSGIDGVQMPTFDDWRPKQVYPDTSSLLTILMQVDLTDPFDLCSLTDLGSYLIDPDILAFMVKEGSNMLCYGQSIINIALYSGGLPLAPNMLTIDENLNLRTTYPMNPRQVYHLRISLVNDLLSLPTSVQDRTRRQGVACSKLLATLEANLPGGVILPKLVAGQLISRADFLAAGQRINSLKVPLKSQIEYIILATVGNFVISTGRG